MSKSDSQWYNWPVDLASRIRPEVTALADESELTAVYLHGSHTTGTARSDSDIDIAILTPHEWTSQKLEAVMDRLTTVVARETGLSPDRIDIQSLRDAPAAFRVRVLYGGQLLYVRDPTELARFQGHSMSEHWDNEIFLRPIREAMRKRIAEGRFAT